MCELYSGNDDNDDRDKIDEKGRAVLDKIRMTTHEDYLKVQTPYIFYHSLCAMTCIITYRELPVAVLGLLTD